MGIINEFGIQLDTSDAIIRRIFDRQRADEALGEGWVSAPSSPNTALVASFANEVRIIQEDLATIYNSLSPSKATGQALFELGERQGLFRRDATFSRVTLTLNLEDNTTVLAGSRVRVPGAPQMTYETLQTVTNETGDTNNFNVQARAIEPGPGVFASAGTLTEIVDTETGWLSVTNAADSTQGLRPETESEFYLRLVQSAAIAGRATDDAIVAAVRNTPGVLSAVMLPDGSNRENVTVDGVPARSFELLIVGGDDDDIAQTVWDANAAATPTFGNSEGNAADIDGNPHVVRFSRPTQVPFKVEVSVLENPDFDEAFFKSEFVQRANSAFGPGDDVTLVRLGCIALNISGVRDILSLEFAKVGDSLGVATIELATRENAFFSTLEVTVL